jgi:hypothetical protein
MLKIMTELKSIHLFINKCIHLNNNVFMIYLNEDKCSFYTLKQLNQLSNQDSNNTFFKLYNPDNYNLNNSEAMATLYYSTKFNTFVIKSITIIKKIYEPVNKYNNKRISKKSQIVNNILNLTY